MGKWPAKIGASRVTKFLPGSLSLDLPTTEGPKALTGDESLMGVGASTRPQPVTILASWLPVSWPLASELISG